MNEKMTKADKMFEKIDFQKIHETKNQVVYERPNQPAVFHNNLRIDMYGPENELSKHCDTRYLIKFDDGWAGAQDMTAEIFEAVNAKLEEKGWKKSTQEAEPEINHKHTVQIPHISAESFVDAVNKIKETEAVDKNGKDGEPAIDKFNDLSDVFDFIKNSPINSRLMNAFMRMFGDGTEKLTEEELMTRDDIDDIDEPVLDKKECWEKVTRNDSLGINLYQHRVLPSLFKEVPDEGEPVVVDSDKFRFISIKTNYVYGSRALRLAVLDIYPVTFPYSPSNKRTKICCEEFTANPFLEDEDYDTIGLLYGIDENGDKTEINRYFRSVDNDLFPISEKEFKTRKYQAEIIKKIKES